MEKFALIGKNHPNIDGKEKVTGVAKYVCDIQLAGMLHGKILRSPIPHGKILNIDTSEAERLNGVKAVITAKDTPRIKFSYFAHLADKLPLEDEKVRYIGDEVSAVAAIDEDTAEEAISLIRVEYEELPAFLDPEEAMKPDAPRIHDQFPNVVVEVHRKFGDVDKAFAQADHVFEDKFVTQAVAHCCMGTHGVIAYWDSTGKVTVWSPTQSLYYMQIELARALGIPLSKVRVIKPHVGGGFGSRLVLDMKDPIAAILSKKTGKPIRIINTREEEFTTNRIRYPMKIILKTGVKNNGKLIARQAHLIVDNGAYNNKGPAVVATAAEYMSVLYKIPNTKYDGYLVYTNNNYGGACRGFGNPQITFAIESQMDIIAEKLNIDPRDLRLINTNMPGDVTVNGSKITSCGLKECIEIAAEKAGWDRIKSPVEDRGIGMAAMVHSGGGHKNYRINAADAFIKLNEDGSLNLLSSSSDVGQGSRTTMAIIAAEVIGVNMNDISVAEADTDVTPMDLGAFASRQTFVTGNAVKKAAEEVKKQLFELAAEKLEVHRDDLISKNGKIVVKGSQDKGIKISELAKLKPISGRGYFDDPVSVIPDAVTHYGNALPTYAFACQAVEVEVDKETGKVIIKKVFAAQDIGRAINPIAVEGQIEGAVSQGIGFGLLENMIRENGRIQNPHFLDYRIFTAPDMPSIEVIPVETIDPDGPFGAKGIGEASLIPLAPAIANAIYNATGIRIKDLPITPEKILSAINRNPGFKGSRGQVVKE